MASPGQILDEMHAPNSPELPLGVGAADDSDGATVRISRPDPEDLEVEVPGEVHPSADEPDGAELPKASAPAVSDIGDDDDIAIGRRRGDLNRQDIDSDVADTTTTSPVADDDGRIGGDGNGDDNGNAEEEEVDGDGDDDELIISRSNASKQQHQQHAAALAGPNDQDAVASTGVGDETDDSKQPGHVDPRLSDFEQMMEEKRVQRRSMMQARRRRKDADLISDFDDEAQGFVTRMTKVAETDRSLNEQQKIASGKLLMLPQVLTLLRRRDMQSAFLDHKVLHALAMWLSPMPDGSLPPLEIREGILKLLPEFRDINPDHLKSSGIGKAIMLLFKHPKETKGNRKLAQHIISEWSKPIFGVRDEYERRDKDNEDADEAKEFGPRSAQRGDEDGDGIEDDGDGGSDDGSAARQRPEKRRIAADEEIRKKLFNNDPKPNEPGYIPRARVPHASTTDYINRPKSLLMPQSRRQPASAQKSRLDVLQRRAVGRKAASAQTRAQNVSLSGKHVG